MKTYRVKNTTLKSNKEKMITQTMAAILTSQDMNQAAESLNISLVTLYDRLKNHPEIRITLDEIPRQAYDMLKLSGIKAVKVLIEQLNSTSEKIKQNAAKEVLNRIGLVPQLGPSTLIQVNNTSNYDKMTDQQLDTLIKSKTAQIKILGPINVKENVIGQNSPVINIKK